MLRAVSLLKNKISNERRETSLKWNVASESELKNFLIFCLITPQTRIENLDKIYKGIKNRKYDFTQSNKDDIYRILNENKIRFSKNKFKRIIDFLDSDISIKDVLSKLSFLTNKGLREDRWTRSILMYEVGGLGPKTSSLFLMDVSFCKNLAILDSRNFSFMKQVGLISNDAKTSVLQDLKIYEKIEEWENELAKKLKINTWTLDGVIIYY